MALANTRARLRMVTLYAFAASNNGIVVGTGNKVEDFGVGFYTKYGDGGVDISPIADLYKSEVFSLAGSLGVIKEIQEAPPTDGLWDDGRTDEDQIGATYQELEWAMREVENPSKAGLSDRQKQVMERYLQLNKANSHKMDPIPVFKNGDR
jgi:NAD+ synthase